MTHVGYRKEDVKKAAKNGCVLSFKLTYIKFHLNSLHCFALEILNFHFYDSE